MTTRNQHLKAYSLIWLESSRYMHRLLHQ